MAIVNTLPRPDYRNTLNIGDAINRDIRDVIHADFPIAVEQTNELAKQLQGSNAIETAKNIWQFEKDHITYDKDTAEDQLVRLPSRLIADGYGDCKSYALLAASVLANLHMPVAFRYASYHNPRKPWLTSHIPSHVYVVTKDEHGKEIIIDGVWKYFNSEKKPFHKFDEVMKVYTLSGINSGLGDPGIGINFNKLKRTIKKIHPLNILKTIGLAPARRAYRTLLAMNLAGMGGKHARHLKHNPGEAKKMWEKLGGNFNDLKKSIEIGAKKHPLLGIQGISGDGSIGFIPAAAAVVAAAAPIIVAFAPQLRKEAAVAEAAGGAAAALEAGTPSIDSLLQTASNLTAPGGSYNAAEMVDNGEVPPEKLRGNDEPSGSFKLSPMVLAAAAAIALILINKK